MTQAQLTKKIDTIEQALWSLRRQVTLLYTPKNRQAEVLRQTAGSLKHRIKGDTVAWQKKMRRQWAR